MREKDPSLKRAEQLRDAVIADMRSREPARRDEILLALGELKQLSLAKSLQSALAAEMRMLFLSTSEDGARDATNVNERIWKVGFRFASPRLRLLRSDAQGCSFEIDFPLRDLMRAQYRYSTAGARVTLEDFSFYVLGRRVYHRPIGRAESWTVLFADASLTVVLTSEEDATGSSMYERVVAFST